MGADAGLGDEDPVPGDEKRESSGSVEVDREVAQVAVVDADDLRARGRGLEDLGFARSLGDHVESEPLREGGEPAAGLGLEHREHQEDGVGASGAGGEDLSLVDRHVLGEDRELREGAHPGKAPEASAEGRRLREDRNGVCVAGVGACAGFEVDVAADHAEAR